MTKSNTRDGHLGLSYTETLSLAAGTLGALYMIPSAANATVMAGGGPLSVTLGVTGDALWDIDGDGNDDFRLDDDGCCIDLESNGLSGQGIVQATGAGSFAIARLATSFRVGPTLATGYQFSPANLSQRTVLDTLGPSTFIAVNGFAAGDNLIGLQFLIGGAMHYAWANINVDLTAKSVTIVDWFWESDARTAIHVGTRAGVTDVPEPGTAGLTLLGLGAAGLTSWRRRKAAEKAA